MAFFIDHATQKIQPVIDLFVLFRKLKDAELLNSSTPDSLQDLALVIVNDANPSPPLAESLVGIGLTDAEIAQLKSLYGKLGNDAQGVADKLSVFIKQLDDMDEDFPLSLDWEKAQDAEVPLKDAITLELEGFGSLKTSVNYKSEDSSLIVKAGGDLGYKGKLKIPFSYGALSMHSEGSVGADVEFSFKHDNNTRFYEAILADYRGFDDVLDPVSFVKSPVTRFALSTTGEVKLGGDVEIGKSWSTEWNLKNDLFEDGLATPSTELAVNIKLGYEWSKQGCFELVLTHPDDNTIHVALHNTDKNSQERSLSLGANIKFTGTDKVIEPLLQQITKWPSKLIKLLDEYSKPGDLLRDALKDALASDSNTKNALVEVILGDEEAGDFVKQLTDRLAEVISENKLKLDEVLGEKKEQVVDWVLEKSPLDTDQFPMAENELEKLYDEAVAKVMEKLSTKLQELDDDAANKFVELLQESSSTANATIEKINAGSEELLKPVSTLITKYHAVKEKFDQAVEAINKSSLGLEYSRIATDVNTADLELGLLLDTTTPECKSIYKNILGGDFSDALADGLAGGGCVTLVESKVSELLSRNVTTSINFDLFGSSSKSIDILNSELTLEYDMSGNISVFANEATKSTIREGFGESRSVKIASAIMLAGGKGDRQMPLSLTVKHEDDNLTQKEIQEFLISLEKVALLESGVTKRFMESASVNQDEETSAVISLLFTMDKSQLQVAAKKESWKAQHAAVKKQVEYLKLFGTRSPLVLKKLENAIGRPTDAFIISCLQAPNDKKMRDELIKGFGTGSVTRRKSAMNLSLKIKNNAKNLELFLDQILELIDMPVPVVVNGRIPKETSEAFVEANKELIASMKGWIDPRTARLGRRGKEFISPWVAALILTLKALSGDDNLRLVPVITWTENNKERKELVSG